MGRGLLALILVLGAAIGAARAQSCDEELPASLSNYSGLACSAVWNNYILRVIIAPPHDIFHLFSLLIPDKILNVDNVMDL